MTRGRVSLLGAVRALLDPTLIFLSLLLSSAIAASGFGAPELVLGVIAFSLTFPSEVSLHKLRGNLLSTILVNWLLIVAILVFFGYATRFLFDFDQTMLLWWIGLTPVLQYAAHRSIPYLVPQLLAIDGFRTAVIVAANDVGRRLARNFVEHRELGFRFLGFFDDQEEGAAPGGEALAGPILGKVDEAASYAREHRVESVFIALPMALQPRLARLLDEIQDTTASVYFVPDIFITDLINARVDEVNGMPVMSVCESPIVGFDALVKRASDVVLSLVAIVALAPVLLAVAAGVKASSPGPVLFRQRRYGLDGRQIVVWKFRSMTVSEDGDTVLQATKGDQRVTPLGAFLRRTSLDELPQLFNVLAGSMSLVGPRPHAVAHNEQYRGLIKGYMVRHKVRPGITGWAQVHGLRGETDSVDKMRRRIEYDLEYLRRWSISLDLLILFKTAAIVLRRTNAY